MKGIRAAALAMGLLAAGCSLILSTAEPTQCSTTADCRANPAFRNLTCEQGFCIVPGPAIGGGDKPDAGAPACVSTEQCTKGHGGEGWHCTGNGGQCVRWEAEGCTFGSSGAWMDENAIIIGTVLPFTNKEASGKSETVPYADRVRKAIDMAVEEIAVAQPGGIVPTGSPARPIAVLHCNSNHDPVKAQAVFDHLTEVVGAKAVIVGADDDLAAVAPRARTRGTAIVCSDCVGAFPEPPLAWRIVPPSALQAPMAASRVLVLEAQRKAEPNPPTSLRVALLTQAGAADQALADELTARVKFNGKSASENENGAAYRVERTEDPREVDVDHVAHAKNIANFRPDVIMVAMGDDFPVFYLAQIEAEWPSDKPLPYYIVTERNYDEKQFQLLNDNDDRRKRISGTCTASSLLLQSNIDGFKNRFLNRYPGVDPSGNWSGYDAAYALVYAMQAASIGSALDGPTAGSAISDGFKRLRGGTSINVGKNQIASAFLALGQSTQTIDLRGLWSELDWNLVTRDLDSDIGMYCFENDGGKIKIKPDAGPRRVAGSDVVTGSYVCD